MKALKRSKVKLIEPPAALTFFVLEHSKGLPTMEEVYAWYVDHTLVQCGGSVSMASAVLNLANSTVYRHLQRQDRERPNTRESGTMTTDRAFISFTGFRQDVVRVAKTLAERLEEKPKKVDAA